MDYFKRTGMRTMGFHAATFQMDEDRPGHVQATVELFLLTEYDRDSPENGPEVTAEWSKPDRFHDGPVRSIRPTYDPTKAADPFAVK
jgi:hypothetical protein